MKRHLTYANVTSTLALVLALGAGGAYAVDRIGSRDVRNNSLRSDDLKNRVAVKSKDVKKNALTGKEIRESTLDASGFASVSGTEQVGCFELGVDFEQCATKSVKLKQTSRILAVGTGDQVSEAGTGGAATCQIQVDGLGSSVSSHPGEVTTNTSVIATNGFARTRVSRPLDRGAHEVALVCKREGSSPVSIQDPTLALIAIGSK